MWQILSISFQIYQFCQNKVEGEKLHVRVSHTERKISQIFHDKQPEQCCQIFQI